MVGVELEMILKLIHHSRVPPRASAENDGFDLREMHAIRQRLEEIGVPWKTLDARTISTGELENLYLEATVPTARRKYQIRQVFGSKRRAGCFFGREVPALLVYEPGKPYPLDVLPHRRGTRTVTIRAFLDDLVKTLEGATPEPRRPDEVLIARMDRLRKKIGPLGVSVARLVREGRRR